LTLPRQPYFDYSAIVDRPQFSWPGGKRLAFHLCLNLEAFAYNTGLGISYSPGLPHPNSYNWGWREYGNRVGVWRLLKLFDQLDLPVSLLLNSACYEHCPEVVAASAAAATRSSATGAPTPSTRTTSTRPANASWSPT
jgi:allantoinase